MKKQSILSIFFIAALLPAALFAQKKESLVVFPFTGSNTSDGAAIASAIIMQPPLQEAFNQIALVTRNANTAQNLGMTDADTIFEQGKQLNAACAIAGHITKFEDKNLVIISFFDIENLRLIGGDFLTYMQKLDEEETNEFISGAAEKLAAAVMRGTNLPGLLAPQFNVSKALNQNDAMLLSQILTIELANGNQFAVLPRANANAQYSLSGSIQRVKTENKFTINILDVPNGRFIDGHEESYSDFSKGFDLALKAAVLLGGGSGSSGEDFVYVQGGTFEMGGDLNPSEKPVHTVTVKSFNMGKFPVTQKEWFDLMGTVVLQQRDKHDKWWKLGTNPIRGEGNNFPMYYVNWHEAVKYCNRLSLREGLTPVYRGTGKNIVCDWNADGYRLPTEAEWEYAAKGGDKDVKIFEYSGNDNVNIVAWYTENSETSTKHVGMKAPNSLGLHDMSGNVWEWCWDWYGNYSSAEQVDPVGALSGTQRVLRGGSWISSSKNVRSAHRSHYEPSHGFVNVGFRLVRN